MVAPLVASALIGAGGSVLGGLFGQRSQQKMAEANIKYQKQFAKNAVQWKTEDSLKAGIHPLFGLGAQTHSFAPVAVGDSIGPAISQAGQEIGRAVGASMTGEQQATSKVLATLGVERASLENDLLRSQIRAINAPGSPPPLPSVSGDNSSPIKMFGHAVQASPSFSDAADFQQRYGEPAEWLAFPAIAAADAARNTKFTGKHNYHKPTVADIARAVGRLFGY